MKPSEKQIDRLFKNKLDQHRIEPTENAWEKVEASLSKKNNMVLWRWAAAVLLTGVLLTLAYQWQKNENNNPSLAQKQIKHLSPQNNSDKNIAAQETASVHEDRTHQRTVPAKPGKSSNPMMPSAQASKTTVLLAKESASNKVAQKNEPMPTAEKLALPKVNEQEKIKPNATSVIQTASTQQKPIKLEFTLDDFSSEQTVATVADEKKSGFKKILDLARELKQGEGPVSNFREMKNEIFAHNFISKKKNN